MSDKWEVIRRIWFKTPRRDNSWSNGRTSRYVDRHIPNSNVTERAHLSKPREFVGNGHYSWELFYHEDVVQDLIALLKRVSVAIDTSGPLPADEIHAAIKMYERPTP